MHIKLYDESKKKIWNQFINDSKNGTFLLLRDYMDYHSDRFNDNSLMFYDDKDNLIALLPANRIGNIIDSHGGLTYGGFITNEKMKTPIMIKLFENLIEYSRRNNIDKILYKPIPYIYSKIPSQEDLYALFLNDAKLYCRNVSSTINLNFKVDYETRRRRQIKKALKNNIVISESYDYDSYWSILVKNLMENHNAKPVHTVDEIKKLHELFNRNIRLFCAYKDNEMLGGVLVYESLITIHVQYISATEEGKKIGVLDLIFDKLINEKFSHKRYFDFGISNEDMGRYLNKGLIDQKEGFGASAVVYDQYLIQL